MFALPILNHAKANPRGGSIPSIDFQDSDQAACAGIFARIASCCFSCVVSRAEPFGNHSRFQIVIRNLFGSGDCPSTEPTTTKATRASNMRFTKQPSLAG